jgi:hypothetical protein
MYLCISIEIGALLGMNCKAQMVMTTTYILNVMHANYESNTIVLVMKSYYCSAVLYFLLVLAR